MRTDVLIAGVGPAGCAAAVACRAAGLAVVMLRGAPSSARRPWESIPFAVDGLVHMLGFGTALARAARGLSDGVCVSGPDNVRFEYPARQVDRFSFDRLIVEEARRQGAEIVEEAAGAIEGSRLGIVVRLASGKEITARWAIDATGRRRALVRKLGWPIVLLSAPLVVRSAMIEAPGCEYGRDNDLTFRADGWFWRTRPWRRRRSWTALQRAADSIPHEVETLTARSLPRTLRTVAATWDLLQPAEDIPLFAVGDAMGTIDPASGTGLLNSLTSALAAARAITGVQTGEMSQQSAHGYYAGWCRARVEAQARQLADHYARQRMSVAPMTDPSSADVDAADQAMLGK